MAEIIDNTEQIGFIFDLDGTLINSTEIGNKIENEVYKRFDINPDEKTLKEVEDLVYEVLHGENRRSLGMTLMWKIFKKLDLSFINRIKALIMASKIYREEIPKVKLFDGVKELFEFLDKNSYKYSIATTSSAKEVDDRLIKFPEFYDKMKGKIVSRSSVKQLKPHSESFEKAAKIINIPVQRCVMIGDMHTDILMGKNVGVVTIGVLTGMFKEKNLKKHNPDFIFDSVANIPENINQILKKVRENNRMAEKSKFGFVFDLDGTLINSTDISFKIQDKIREEFNIVTTVELETELEDMADAILEGNMTKLSAVKVIIALLKRLGLSFKQRVKALVLVGKLYVKEKKNVDFFDGVQELFTFLKEKEINYAIATGSSKKEVAAYLQKYPDLLEELIPKMITRDMVSNHKPHIESLEKAATILNIPVKNCIVVGDLHFDIMMGKAGGALTICVLTGYLSKEKAVKYEPDFVIESVANIPEILNEILEKIKN